MKDMIGGCCVCSDERGWPDNPLVYCDGNGCTVAVHQACYGIVTVPTGPWFCRKCESPEENKGRVRCELCPSKSGALKRTDSGGWAHVVCALYIPEVRFGNVTSMEPIVLRLIPPERFNKTCYICHDAGKNHRSSAGACMQCNKSGKSGCKQQFHVTCAQSLGLLCEEAGNYLDNVKYCGYCQHHYSKLKKGGNVKTIPPYKPIGSDSASSDSSGEKDDPDPSPDRATPSTSRRGAGRKSSHSGASTSGIGKSTPGATKTVPTATITSYSQSAKAQSEKIKKSPSGEGRRSSSVGEPVASTSKASTPAPSPQHSPHPGKGGSTPKSLSQPASSPVGKIQESVGVISTVTSAGITSTPTSTIVSGQAAGAGGSAKPQQESVITNTELAENKHTKKRKAATQANNAANSAAAAAAAAVEFNPPANPPSGENTSSGANMWDASVPSYADPLIIDNPNASDKSVKKARTDAEMAGFMPQPPLPPPTYGSPNQPTSRHAASPNVAGQSGSNTLAPSNIRSPSQTLQGLRAEREAPQSLLVSVPLPTASQGLNLSVYQGSGLGNDGAGPSSHIMHSSSKQATGGMDSSAASGHSPLAAPPPPPPPRSQWPGLNVSYEAQPIDNSAAAAPATRASKESGNVQAAGNPTTIRTKKRAAMAAASVVAHANTTTPTPAPTPPIHGSNANQGQAKRMPQPTPPPIYQETIKDSPPSSPGSERSESLGGLLAPHMLGNELNPSSGAAARLHEQLTAELAAHASAAHQSHHPLPPPLINKATQGTSRSSSTGGAQSLDQLLERQWEQGSQFLMEQAQHFDIASLLSCLHQLRTENVRLEEHVGSLLQRRDHLLAVNARLAIPLTAVIAGPSEPTRCSRESSVQLRAPANQARPDNLTSERPHQLMMQKPS